MKFIKEIVFVLLTFTAFTQSLWWRKRVCYGKYGCFDKSRSLWFPQKPSKVGTKFNLFTRFNRETPQIIDDHNTNKLRASNFRISRKRTIFVIHGYRESINTWARPMKEALLAREDCNVILVDWSKGAKSLLYPRAAGNTQLVGAQIAVLIRFLISSNKGTSSWANRFYIVGFSLGAQTAGFAGSNLRSHRMRLGRITGLDPASVLFSKAKVNYRLDPGDAQYVDVIHTDAGGFGTSTKMGHIDFYPNGGSRQPGCSVAKTRNIIRSLSCDHMRAPQYYTASVKKLCSWTAYPCSDYNNAKCLNCNGKCPSMGYDADRTARRGIFYLKTNSNAPFCGKMPKGR